MAAGNVERVEFGGKSFTLVRVKLDEQSLRLFWKDSSGRIYKSFDAVQKELKTKGEKLVFAMNAGMYHADFLPVGLYVENGREVAPLNLKKDEGNFFLLPNGVFAVTDAGASVVESSRYPAIRGKVLLATQSGPMLVLDGKIHSAFRADSTSRLIRNGVGIVSPEEVVFAIAEDPVNFYEFSLLFRDHLQCRNALFLDGTISSLYSEALKRNDRKIDLGPIIGVVAKE